MRIVACAFIVAAFGFAAHAGDLPDPPGCAGFNDNKTGGDPACDAAIAKETDPAAKSILLYRRAYMIIDRHDFKTYPKALEDLSEAIRLLPTNFRALHERSYIYNEYGRWADALKDIDARIALEPQVFQGYLERAMARFYLGDLQGRYEDRNAVVLLRPNIAGPLIGRAEAAIWLGRFNDAAKDLDAAAALNSKTEAEARDIEGYRADIAKLTKTSKQGAKACTDSGAPAVFQSPTFIGDCTRAFLDAATAKAKADALTLRGIGGNMTGEDGNARVDFAIAVAFDPENPAAHANLAFADMQARHSTAAIAEFDRALALKPQAITYAGRASAKLNLNDIDGALADAKTSLGIERNELGLIVLGDATYEKTKSYDEAKSYWIGAYRMGNHSDALVKRLKDAGVPIPPPEETPKQ
jgi:tetratricopeptide (TPR) repeat protein